MGSFFMYDIRDKALILTNINSFPTTYLIKIYHNFAYMSIMDPIELFVKAVIFLDAQGGWVFQPGLRPSGQRSPRPIG